MYKIKEYFKVKKNIAVFSICALLVISIAAVAIYMITKKPPANDIIPTTVNSEQTSSETASSKPTVKVPEIVAPSSKESVSSKDDTLELKVDGNSSSKVTEKPKPKPTEKPKASSSKAEEKPKPQEPVSLKQTTPKNDDGIDAETQKILDELGFTDGPPTMGKGTPPARPSTDDGGYH